MAVHIPGSIGSAPGIGAVGAMMPVKPKEGTAGDVVGSFSDALTKAMKDIDGMQGKADDLIQRMQTGKVKDVHEVMAAVEEAGLAMQLALQLRNKALDAYQEIMRMQV